MAHTMKTPPITPAPTVRFISPQQLQQMTKDNPSAIQVVDSRSFMNYNMERIIGSVNVYCPPLVKRRFQHCLPLKTMLTPETKVTLCRPSVETIVVHDQCTDEVLYHLSQTDLPLVLFSLAQFLGDRTYLVLAGGYCQFRQEYPNLCSSHTSLSGQLRHVTRNGSPKNSLNPVSPSSLSALNLVASKSHPILSLTPVELLPYLYIGDAGHSTRRELLKRLDITAILNVSTSCENHFPYEFRYKVIPVEDSNNANLLEWFQDAIFFIEHEHRNGGKVLVHCHGGISRSATVCLAYLMYTRQWRLNDAFDYVKSRRHMISPNTNFMMQLSQFEMELRNLGFDQSAAFLQKPLSPIRLLSFASCPDMGRYNHIDVDEGNEEEAENNDDDDEYDDDNDNDRNYFLKNVAGRLQQMNGLDKERETRRNSYTNNLEIGENNNEGSAFSDADMSNNSNLTYNNNDDNGVHIDNNNDDNGQLTLGHHDLGNQDTAELEETGSKSSGRQPSTPYPHLTSNNMSFFTKTLTSTT